MQKNGADATDIEFIVMWLADRNLQIDFNRYSGTAKMDSFLWFRSSAANLLATASTPEPVGI